LSSENRSFLNEGPHLIIHLIILTMKADSRREFLRKSVLGISGIALVPGSLKMNISEHVTKTASAELPVRLLGKSGLKIPLISMGTSDTTSSGLIRTAYESGVKLFFSATYYGEGNNEKLVGEGLKGLPRDSFIVGTAVPPDGMDMKTGTFPNGFDAAAYIKKAEGSLKRFGLDYVDFFLFPYAGKKETVLNENVLKALTQLKKQGKTRFLGIASHDNTEEALKAAADSGVYDIAMPAYNFKVKNKESMNTAIAYAVKAGMGIVAMKTTAGGARDKSGTPLNINAALKWVLQNENVSSIVSGMSSFEHLQNNLALLNNLKMTDQELKDLNITAQLSESGLYCLQCKECIPDCPNNLDIPTMMRSYMYAYGYKNIKQAWNTIAEVRYSKQCDDCRICTVNCRASFNVKNKIKDITRLKDVPSDLIQA
jgi:predicted aldo/keto reductase-like oxidoreductase